MRIPVRNLGSLGVINDPYEQDVPANAFTRVRNARFDEKGAQSILGDTEIFNAADAATPITPLWVKYFPDRTRPRWVYADNNKVWVYENFVHTEITRAASDYNAVDRWQGSVFNGIGILNNGFDAPQQWNPIDDSQVLADLSNWPANYRCRFIQPFKNFLIAGHIYDGSSFLPYRLHWSHPAAPGSVPTSWALGTPGIDAGEKEVTETSDVIVDGRQMGDQFIVYRENTNWAMALTGNNEIFRLYSLSQAAGALWKDCISETPKGHVVASWDDLYIHQGSKQSHQSLLKDRTRRWVVANRDPDYYRNSFTVINEPHAEVWYCFPQIGHIYASLALIWNWNSGQVGFRDLSEVPFADAGPVVLAA